MPDKNPPQKKPAERRKEIRAEIAVNKPPKQERPPRPFIKDKFRKG